MVEADSKGIAALKKMMGGKLKGEEEGCVGTCRATAYLRTRPLALRPRSYFHFYTLHSPSLQA